MVGAELELEAVGRLHRRARHDPRVVDHDVQRRMAREEAIGEGANLLRRAELQLCHLDLRVAGRLADARGNGFTLRQVAGGEDHVRAPIGEHPRRLLADPARAAGDQRHLAPQVDPFAHLARRGVGAELRRVAHGMSFPSPPGIYHVGRRREARSTRSEPGRARLGLGRASRSVSQLRAVHWLASALGLLRAGVPAGDLPATARATPSRADSNPDVRPLTADRESRRSAASARCRGTCASR